MEAILPFCHFSDDFVFITVQRNGIKTNASWRDSRWFISSMRQTTATTRQQCVCGAEKSNVAADNDDDENESKRCVVYECVLWKWTEIGIDFSLHENCECREIGADMRIFIAFGSDCSVGEMAKRLWAEKRNGKQRKAQSKGEMEAERERESEYRAFRCKSHELLQPYYLKQPLLTACDAR